MYLVLALALVQGPVSAISGRVVDASGGALAGATIAVICGDARAHRPSPIQRADIASISLPAAAARSPRRSMALPPRQAAADLTAPAVEPPRLSSRGAAVRAADRRDADARHARGRRRACLKRRRWSIARRSNRVPYAIVTQALKEEAGVLAQQTTASQGSPILRGFTGQRNRLPDRRRALQHRGVA